MRLATQAITIGSQTFGLPYADLLPDLTESEYRALREDIIARGIQVPIVLDESSNVIDGQHRLMVAWEVLSESGELIHVPTIIKPGLNDDARELLAYDLNLHRRHLTREQRQEIAARLDAKGLTLAQIAERLHVSNETVRLDLLESGTENNNLDSDPRSDRRISNGRVRPKRYQKRAQPKSATIYADGLEDIPKAQSLLQNTPIPDESGTINIGDLRKIANHIAGQQRRANHESQRVELPTPAIVTGASWDAWLPYQDDCDLLLTDPPYSTDVPDIAAFAAAWLPSALAKVKYTGRAYICIGAYPDEIAAYLAADRQHMTLAQILIWTYRNATNRQPKYDYILNYQAILYFRGPDAPPLDAPDTVEQFAVQDINAPDARLQDERHRLHAWQKPDELAERLIRHSTKTGDLVLDPFAGTGTFVLAAARLGRDGRGCDTDQDMLAIATARGCAIG